MPIAVPPQAPRKIALWATILTGAYAATSVLVGAIIAPATVETLKKQSRGPAERVALCGPDPRPISASPLAIASFVLLALWMSKIRAARTARGEAIGGPPAVEWWGWFVPLANIVLPFLGMRAITKARAGMGLLARLVARVRRRRSGVAWRLRFAEFTAIDFSTGKLAHPEALDSIVGLTWASAIAMVVSWVFLAMIIRVTTRRQAEASLRPRRYPTAHDNDEARGKPRASVIAASV